MHLRLELDDSDDDMAWAAQMAALTYANFHPDRGAAESIIREVGRLQDRDAEWVANAIKQSDCYATNRVRSEQESLDPPPAV